MFDYTIEQLIPAPAGMYEVGTDNGEEYRMPVVAIALTRDNHGTQRVIPLSMDSYGDIDSASGCRIVWEPVTDTEKASG